MKTLRLSVCFFCFVCGLLFAASATLPAWQPITVTLVGAPFPKAIVTSVDAAAGTFLFAWLDSNENRVDSGNSVGRFTPSNPPAYPSEATLKSAIVAAAR